MSDYKINTKCVQAGYRPGNGEPRVLPVYQSTTYRFTSAAQLGDLFDLAVPYSMRSRHREIKAQIDALLAERGKDYKTVISFDETA